MLELIFVDNGSSDNTKEILANYAKSSHLPVVIIEESKPGLSRARNAALALASGEIVVFTDDDCYPQKTYISDIHTIFLRENFDFLGGRILLFDVADAPVTIQPSETPVIFQPYSFLPPGAIHGANIAIRINSAKKTGVFDILLGAGTNLQSGEDIEYLQRMLFLGMYGAYIPNPTVFHHHGRKPGQDIQKLIDGYALGRGAYLSKLFFMFPFSIPLLVAIIRKLAGNLIRRDWKNLFLEIKGFRLYQSEANGIRKLKVKE